MEDQRLFATIIQKFDQLKGSHQFIGIRLEEFDPLKNELKTNYYEKNFRFSFIEFKLSGMDIMEFFLSKGIEINITQSEGLKSYGTFSLTIKIKSVEMLKRLKRKSDSIVFNKMATEWAAINKSIEKAFLILERDKRCSNYSEKRRKSSL